jgi:hypothetical protein
VNDGGRVVDDEPNETAEKHWSELSGEWYYVGTVDQQWDHIIHDVEAEDLANEVSGMFFLWRDGHSMAAPVTRIGWELWADLDELEENDPEPVCVGRVVDGLCEPIGIDEDEDWDWYGNADIEGKGDG